MFFGLFRKKESGSDGMSGRKSTIIHNIDTSMKYCPCCGEEYRADFKTCGVCNLALVDGWKKLEEIQNKLSKKRKRTSLEMPLDAELVAVQKGGVREMKLLRRRLTEEGIPSMLSGEQGGCAKSCCGPEMQLLVDKADLEEVHEVLAKDYVRTTALESHLAQGLGLDASDSESVCPACSCTFPTTVGACPDCGLQFN